MSAHYGINSFLFADNIVPLDYFETLLPALAERGGSYHLFLQPGRELRPIRYDRFSPYQQKPEQYGIELQVNWAYHHIYPLPEEKLAKLVYIFHGEGEATLVSSPFRVRQVWADRDFPSLVTPGRDALQQRLREWLDCFLAPMPYILCMDEQPDRTDILDTRPSAPARRAVLEELAHRVHRKLHGALAFKLLHQAVEKDGEGAVEATQLEATLPDLLERRLVLRMGACYLALAAPGDMPSLPNSNQQGYPGGWINRLTNQDSVKNERLTAGAGSS